jgi:hypothetical protein
VPASSAFAFFWAAAMPSLAPLPDERDEPHAPAEGDERDDADPAENADAAP